MTIANAHDLLWQSDAAGELDLGDLVERLCVQLQQQMPALAIQTRTDRFVVDADRAIAAGLLVTELVTNASKHAYGGGVGNVMVSCTQVDGWFKISVADQGKGLPADFVIERAGTASLGMRMIRALAVQLGGHIEFKSTTGTEFFVSAEANTTNTKK